MAIVNTKSTEITALDLLTGKKVSPLYGGCRPIIKAATVEVAAADDPTSVYRFFRVHSSWRMALLFLANDAIASGTSYDIGLHQIAENGGAVLDADFWGSAVSMASARSVWTEISAEGVTTPGANPANCEKAIWEQNIAVTATDPNRWYDVTMTANVIGSAAGTISLQGILATPN